MKTLSKAEKRELKFSTNPLRKLRADLISQGMTLESFLQLCYDCDLNPLPMLRAKGIKIGYYKDVSYYDVSVHHDNNDWVVLNYPDYGRYEEWTRFNNRYHELENLAEQKAQRGLNRPHRTIRKRY